MALEMIRSARGLEGGQSSSLFEELGVQPALRENPCKMYSNESNGSFPTIRHWDCGDGSNMNPVKKHFCVNAMAVYPEYLTDPAILLCPSASNNKGVAGSFNDADNRTVVWNGQSYVPTKGVGNKEFYPCEVNSMTCNYFYLGWALHVPGITDDPHKFTSQNWSDLLTELQTYFQSKPGLDASLVTGLQQVLGDIVVKLTSTNASIDDQDIKPYGSSMIVYRLREGISVSSSPISTMQGPAIWRKASCPSRRTPSIPTRLTARVSTMSPVVATCCTWTATLNFLNIRQYGRPAL